MMDTKYLNFFRKRDEKDGSTKDDSCPSKLKINFKSLFKKNSQTSEKSNLTTYLSENEELVDRLLAKSFSEPEQTDQWKEIETYWLNEPYAYTKIVRNQNSDLLYQVYEPLLSPREGIVLTETSEHLRSVVMLEGPSIESMTLDDETIFNAIKTFDSKIDEEIAENIKYYVKRNFQGYGKLDPLMNDKNIEDITCNGYGIPVFLYHRKYSNIETNIQFEKEEINKFVLKLAQKADKSLSLTTPLIDATLPGGARAQITYTDVVSTKGSSFTIRKFKSEPMTPLDLMYYGTYDANLMSLIWLAVENRKSLIIVGGTASGKTSTMNAMSFFIPQNAKIVSIEDTREIMIPHFNWLPMRTRESVAESGKGDVSMFSLLKTALRQRPEYIIVGEVRGREAQTLFQAMNTGHTTYSTLHAGSVDQAINRLTTEPINVPKSMFGALDLFMIQQMQYINGKAVRRCTSLYEVETSGNEIKTSLLYSWNPSDDTFRREYSDSQIIDEIAYSRGWSKEQIYDEIESRREFLQKLSGIENLKISEFSRQLDRYIKGRCHGSGS